MKNKLMKSAAIAGLMLSTAIAIPAQSFAQDAGTTAPAASDPAKPSGTMTPGADSGSSTMAPADNGGSMTNGAASDTTTAPATDNAANPATTTTDTAAAAGTDEMYVTEQADNQVLASTYMGQSVYNTDEKSIGEINDIVFDKDGGISAAVIGVGGFLGIGEKNVAVNFDQIKIEDVPNTADVKLVLAATADELKNAPEFKTMEQKVDEQNTSSTGSGSMGSGAATTPATTTPAQ